MVDKNVENKPSDLKTLREAVRQKGGQAVRADDLLLKAIEDLHARVETLEARTLKTVYKVPRIEN